MANNCYFVMKIAGKIEAVDEFVQMLKRQGRFERNGLGCVFSFEVDESLSEKCPGNDSIIAVTGCGDCAWSLETALLDYSLLDTTKRLGLVVEAYSSEPGLEFQEHILVNKDEMVIDDCVDYEEHLIESAPEEIIQEVMADHELAREELMAQVNDNGDFCVGGFENFGDFENLFSYFEPEREPVSLLENKLPLDNRIQTAIERNYSPAISQELVKKGEKERER